MKLHNYIFSILFFLGLFTSFDIYSQEFSQDRLLTIRCSEAPLRSILNFISRKENVSFVYDDLLVKDIFKTIDIKDMLLESTLALLFKDTQIDYKRTNQNQFILFKAAPRIIDVMGLVYDISSGESLPYANIQIKDTRQGTTTNQHGYFTLLNVPVGETILIIQYIGYETRILDLNHFNQFKDLKIGLKQIPLLTKEITIKGDWVKTLQAEKDAGKCAISPNQLASLPAIGDKDVSRALQLLPGITTDNYGGSGVNIRGGRTSENLILLDGMTLYHMYHSFGYFSAFNSNVIKDVRVYKGGFPANYGDRISGVLNMTIKDGNFIKPQINIGVNQMSTHGSLELPIQEKGSILISGRGTISDYITGSLYDKVFVPLNRRVSPIQYDQELNTVRWDTLKTTNVSFYDLLSKLTFNPDKHNLYTFSFYKSYDSFEFENQTQLSQYIEYFTLLKNKNEASNWGNTGISGQWYHEWSSRANSTLQAAYSNYHTDYNLIEYSDMRFDNNGQGAHHGGDNWQLLPSDSTINYSSKVNNDVKDKTLRFENVFKVNKGLDYEFGFSYTNYQIKYRLEELLKLMEGDEPEFIEQNAGAELYTYYNHSNWQVNKNLLWNLGLRSSYYSLTNSTYFEPRLSVNYTLYDNFVLKSAWGKYNQFILQAYEGIEALDGHISWLLANKDEWMPASAIHTIAGVQYNTPNYAVDIEFYTKNMEGELNPLYYTQNIDTNNIQQSQNSTKVYGVDFLIHKKAGVLNGWLSYTYSNSESHFTQNQTSFNYQTSHNIPHKLNFVMNYNFSLFEMSLTWNYASGRPYSIPTVAQSSDDDIHYLQFSPDTFNKERLPNTQRIDLSLSRSLHYKHFSGNAGISVFNVLNQDNIWYRYFNILNNKLNTVDVYMFGTTVTLSLDINL